MELKERAVKMSLTLLYGTLEDQILSYGIRPPDFEERDEILSLDNFLLEVDEETHNAEEILDESE